MAPTGKLIQGHVLDVAVKPFVETMRFTLNDPLLYVKWNSKKCGGWGCWEIRRAPEYNSALDVSEYDGNLIFKVGPKEYDVVHHVLDCAFLNYDAIRKLREMDSYQYGDRGKNLQDEWERARRGAKEKALVRRENEKKYMVKHYRKEIRGWMEAIKGGENPYAIAQHWDAAKEVD
jgi:hypothetical protein